MAQQAITGRQEETQTLIRGKQVQNLTTVIITADIIRIIITAIIHSIANRHIEMADIIIEIRKSPLSRAFSYLYLSLRHLAVDPFGELGFRHGAGMGGDGLTVFEHNQGRDAAHAEIRRRFG